MWIGGVESGTFWKPARGHKTAINRKYLISMSGISGDCTIVFPTFETLDLVVRIVPISQILAKLQVFPVYYGFMAAILNFLLISMSGISGDCNIVFHTFETMDLAVRIVSITQFLAKLQVFPCFPVSSRHLGFSSDIDVAHYRWLHRRVPHPRK